MWLENPNAKYQNMMKIWEKLESKSSYHFPNSWWVRGGILLNTCHFKKLWRGQEDQRKPRTSELFGSETLKHFNQYACLGILYRSKNFCASIFSLRLKKNSFLKEYHMLQSRIWRRQIPMNFITNIQGVPRHWAHFVFGYFVSFYSTKIQKFGEC